ncbi:MAG: hypothetical protein OIF32_02335 [Campylobacterales bacterium]|nr:hypothetical protein [Campylobacterales bacterium]
MVWYFYRFLLYFFLGSMVFLAGAYQYHMFIVNTAALDKIPRDGRVKEFLEFMGDSLSENYEAISKIMEVIRLVIENFQ